MEKFHQAHWDLKTVTRVNVYLETLNAMSMFFGESELLIDIVEIVASHSLCECVWLRKLNHGMDPVVFEPSFVEQSAFELFSIEPSFIGPLFVESLLN